MGLGGVAIAALPSILYPKLSFSDGLGGGNPGESCENPIEVTGLNLYQNIDAAGSYWYKVSFPWAAQETVGVTSGNGNIISVEAKSLDCNAVSNVSNALFPGVTYVKQGINLIKVTVDGPCQIGFSGMNSETGAMYGMDGRAVSCTHAVEKVKRLRAMTLDTEVPYTNAAFETAFSFTPTEDGVYTFINKAPEGTTTKITELDETADGNNIVYSCKEIGDNYFTDKSSIAVNLTAGTEYIITSETFALLEEGMPSLKVIKGDATAINNVKADNNNDIIVKSLGGNSYQVDSYLFKEGATVGVYNMAGTKLYEKTVQPQNEGVTVNLKNKMANCYLFLVIGKSKSACKNIVVK